MSVVLCHCFGLRSTILDCPTNILASTPIFERPSPYLGLFHQYCDFPTNIGEAFANILVCPAIIRLALPICLPALLFWVSSISILARPTNTNILVCPTNVLTSTPIFERPRPIYWLVPLIFWLPHQYSRGFHQYLGLPSPLFFPHHCFDFYTSMRRPTPIFRLASPIFCYPHQYFGLRAPIYWLVPNTFIVECPTKYGKNRCGK